jgi:hypothetical protein
MTRIRPPALSSWRRISVSSASSQERKPVRLGDLGAFVGEREVEERVDAVLGLGSEAGEEAGAAVVADEDAFEEVVGAQEVEPGAGR